MHLKNLKLLDFHVTTKTNFVLMWTSHFTVGGFAFSIYFLAFKRENGRGSLEKKKRRISHDLFSCKIASSMEEWRNVCRLAFINIPSLILKCKGAKNFINTQHNFDIPSNFMLKVMYSQISNRRLYPLTNFLKFIHPTRCYLRQNHRPAAANFA